jgi:hypothetical protein
MKKLGIRRALVALVAVIALTLTLTSTTRVEARAKDHPVTEIENLAYGPADPGNLLDLYVPQVPGKKKLPPAISRRCRERRG